MSSWARLAVAWAVCVCLGLFLVVAWVAPVAGSSVAYEHADGAHAYDTPVTVDVIQFETVQVSADGTSPNSGLQATYASPAVDLRLPADFVAPNTTSFLDDLTAPVGRRGNPIDIAPGTNAPASIGGRQYTGHALDRMQGRGIMPSAVDDAIVNNAAVRGADGSMIHYSASNNISVVLNTDGSVRTVGYGVFKPR